MKKGYVLPRPKMVNADELNPYAKTARRMSLLAEAEAERVKSKKEKLKRMRKPVSKEESATIKAAGKAWYQTMISDSDYTEFDNFTKWLGVNQGQNNRKTEVHVGVVADVGIMHSDVELLCINLSLSDFYSSRPQFQTRLIVNIGDSRDDVVGAATAALELIKNKQVKAIVGPWTSMQAHFMIEISKKSRVPLVSYSATSPFLTSLRSPYFFRATYEDSFQVNAIKAIIKLFGWREAVPVYIDNTFGEGIMPRLTDALQEINVRIPYRSVIALNATNNEISVELLKMMTLPTRVFIVHMATSLASRLFIKAKEIGLMKPGYVWILTNALTDDLSLIDETGIEAMEGVLGVKTYIRKSKDLDKFKARWRKRFPQMELSVYGLWAYDATTALAIAIEKAGTNNLTFSNADAGRNVSELQALGLSQYGPKLLRTLSRVQFKGLAGDFRFVKGQLQPSVFEIVNVIGTGVKSVGFWTEENGLVKKLDQQPRSMSALSTWKDHLKQILWPGEADFVPKGWEIPTNGKRLRIGVPKRTGYTDLVKVTRDPITNSPLVTGFCIDFFEAVIRAMPYDVSYEFIPFEKRNGKPAGNYNDLVHQVYLGKYDAVVGDTTILANRINPDFRGPANYQTSTIIWFAFSTMVFAPRERVFSFGARFLVITWYFIVLVLTQSYTASLASLLTSQQLDPTITSMSSLLEKGETVGYQRTSFIFGKLKETEPFNVDGFGFVFPIGSPLVADVSRAILKVQESPKAMELERAWFKKKEESCPDPDTNPDPNPSFASRQLGLDSFWLLFVVVFVVCLLTLGKFTLCLLWKTNDFWEAFPQQDNDSYINKVEKCPCSSSGHIPENSSQARNQNNIPTIVRPIKKDANRAARKKEKLERKRKTILKEEAAKIKAAGKAWYQPIILDSDYNEFDNFTNWLGATLVNFLFLRSKSEP
ncbi:hypothetical protein AALP_AA6G267100 [Arabis alpina]|uniref:Glutamate receptor n=1 Tax=Arabis alpina TaxID=50452 RepID=A0A087GRW6_ARAAL|nr:hypothetical protein AALP_AA6G267100 [Arabis alpina]